MGRNQKRNKKVKKTNGQQEQSIGLKSEHCAWEAVSQHCEFSQVAKIRNLRNSAGCEIFTTLQNSCSDPISLYFMLLFPSGF